jgi:hypothetical protein
MTKAEIIQTLEDMGAVKAYGVYSDDLNSYYIGGYKGYILPYNMNSMFSHNGNYGFLLMKDGWGTNYDYQTGLEKIRDIIHKRIEEIYLEMKQKSLMFV